MIFASAPFLQANGVEISSSLIFTESRLLHYRYFDSWIPSPDDVIVCTCYNVNNSVFWVRILLPMDQLEESIHSVSVFVFAGTMIIFSIRSS